MRAPLTLGAGASAAALAFAALMTTPIPLPAVGATPADAQGAPRTVACRIKSAGTPDYSGRCRFNPAGGGSFILEHTSEGRPLTGPILTVSVTIVSPDVAEVRGLTRAGINSRWGEARRSTGDRACWTGSDFQICAW